MTTDAVGGVWTYALSLAREFSRVGMRVVLAVIGPSPTDGQRREANRIRSVELRECNESLEWMADPWLGVKRSGEYLLDLASEVKPDIVHLNGYAHGALNFDCPRIVVGHSCVLSWWEAVKSEPPPVRYAEYRRAVAAGLERADQVVVPSASMLRALWRHYGLDRGHVIHNGTEFPEVESGPKETIAFCSGRVWDEAKNVRVVAAAAQGSRVPFYIAGSGSTDERWGCLRALGRLESHQIRSWFARSAIYVSPALYEPFGLATLEAASFGAALVLGDIESQREIWGDAALFVPPRDPERLRSAVERVAFDDALRNVLARRAARRARQFTVEKQARLYADLYGQLIRSRESLNSYHSPLAMF
ncbi:MAG: glycosyltransferase family 4 protein [Polyangiaceae bacterium]